jgi:hypothetical protein
MQLPELGLFKQNLVEYVRDAPRTTAGGEEPLYTALLPFRNESPEFKKIMDKFREDLKKAEPTLIALREKITKEAELENRKKPHKTRRRSRKN